MAGIAIQQKTPWDAYLRMKMSNLRSIFYSPGRSESGLKDLHFNTANFKTRSFFENYVGFINTVIINRSGRESIDRKLRCWGFLRISNP